jgi:hypothetical protein
MPGSSLTRGLCAEVEQLLEDDLDDHRQPDIAGSRSFACRSDAGGNSPHRSYFYPLAHAHHRTFLVVGLIASIRRILVITLEASTLTKEGTWSAEKSEHLPGQHD